MKLLTESVHVRMPTKIMDKIKPLAEKKGLTPSAFIKTIVCEMYS
jgi:predicted DNA-binding protein